MKTFTRIFATLALLVLVHSAGAQPASPTLTPAEAAARVQSGQAILVDVREPAEWADGVASPALLLPLSDLRDQRQQWTPVLAAAKAEGKQVLLYCRSGNRSGQAAALLAKEGFVTANVGSFDAWKDSSLPVRQPDTAADKK